MTATQGRHILFLTRGQRVPSARFRVEAYLPALREAGWRCTVAPMRPPANSTPPPWLRIICLGSERLVWRAWLMLQVLSRLALWWRVKQCDVLFLQKDLTAWPSLWLEKLLIRAARNAGVQKIVLDADDAIWLLYPKPESPENKINQIAAMVDLVLAGNDHSAEHFRQFAPQVTVLPTAINTEKYQPRDPAKVDPNRLVWIGSSGGYPELEVLRDPLAELVTKFPELRLRLVADKPPPKSLCPPNDDGEPHLGGVPVDFIQWNETVEIEALEDAVLGLMPLRDTAWNRGKCGFKLLLYLARGVPAMGSALPANIPILWDDSFLISNQSEWKEKLVKYLESIKSRKEKSTVTFPDRYSCGMNGSLLNEELEK